IPPLALVWIGARAAHPGEDKITATAASNDSNAFITAMLSQSGVSFTIRIYRPGCAPFLHNSSLCRKLHDAGPVRRQPRFPQSRDLFQIEFCRSIRAIARRQCFAHPAPGFIEIAATESIETARESLHP